MSKLNKDAREQRSRIAEILTGQRDRLQRAYDWEARFLSDQDAITLHNVIEVMGRAIGKFKQ